MPIAFRSGGIGELGGEPEVAATVLDAHEPVELGLGLADLGDLARRW
jgi:hypothetical protein